MQAWKGLDSQVYALVSLQVMVTVEGLRACIAFERSILLLGRLAVAIHAMMGSDVLPVSVRHRGHAADESHLSTRICHVAHDRSQW